MWSYVDVLMIARSDCLWFADTLSLKCSNFWHIGFESLTRCLNRVAFGWHPIPTLWGWEPKLVVAHPTPWGGVATTSVSSQNNISLLSWCLHTTFNLGVQNRMLSAFKFIDLAIDLFFCRSIFGAFIHLSIHPPHPSMHQSVHRCIVEHEGHSHVTHTHSNTHTHTHTCTHTHTHKHTHTHTLTHTHTHTHVHTHTHTQTHTHTLTHTTHT